MVKNSRDILLLETVLIYATFFVTELNNLTAKEKVVLLVVTAAFLQVILLLLLNMATTK
jgi:hypothetical protein